MESSEKEKKILPTVVIVHPGRTILSAGRREAIEHSIREKDLDIFVIDNNKPVTIVDNSFEINGIRYEPREEKKTSNHGSSRFNKLALATMALGGGLDMFNNNRYERSLPDNLDIIKEFELIQNKQSKLTRWERDQVCRMFERRFKALQNIEG